MIMHSMYLAKHILIIYILPNEINRTTTGLMKIAPKHDKTLKLRKMHSTDLKMKNPAKNLQEKGLDITESDVKLNINLNNSRVNELIN